MLQTSKYYPLFNTLSNSWKCMCCIIGKCTQVLYRFVYIECYEDFTPLFIHVVRTYICTYIRVCMFIVIIKRASNNTVANAIFLYFRYTCRFYNRKYLHIIILFNAALAREFFVVCWLKLVTIPYSP